MSAICGERLMLVQVSNNSTLFGPMQQDPLIIKDKLFQGIDGDYNVTNMGIVVEVIGELENFHITREELETTRLGKHINELRRRASDKLLASRAKSLVKKWRALLAGPPGSGGGCETANSGPPPGGGNNNNSSLATNGNTAVRLGHPNVAAAVSPRLQPLRSSVSPAMRVPGQTINSQALSPRQASSCRTVRAPPAVPPSPSLPKSGTGTRTSPVVISSTSTSPSHTVSRPASPVIPDSRDPSPPGVHRSLNASPEVLAMRGNKRPRPNSAQEVEVVDLEMEEAVANKRSRLELTNGDRSSDNKTSNKTKTNSISDNLNQTRPKKSVKRPVRPSDTSNILNRQMLMATKAGKVRTTQELVQNLGIESRATSVSPSSCVTDLVPNENKAELMNRFFSSQSEVTVGEAASVDPSTGDEGATSSEATPSIGLSRGPSRVTTPVVTGGDSVFDILSQLPPIDPDAVLAEWEAEQQEEEEEEAEGLIPVFKERVEVTQQLIEDLNTGQLEHVGGIRDHQGEFKEWHELVSLESKDGELLHILPYSVID